MIHRGPDRGGIWVSADQTVGLAHRRLSIIDLSEAGTQPMADSQGQIRVTYNGEIYNFREIRAELEKKGHVFSTNTDTEVLLNSYKEWGERCLDKFNGMFAFCIFDPAQAQFFLARDRVGKKPLYYTDRNNKFVFASELKAIIADRTVSKEMDASALNCFLTFGYIPGDRSIFQRIEKLPPAHAITYSLKTGVKKIWKYWEPPAQQQKAADESELLEEKEG
jgi:asparagine synthase (glutamine-hydrolysing)